MKDLLCDEFQDAVRDALVRHKSVLDTLTKHQEHGARVGRAVVKAATQCGCIQIQVHREPIPDNVSLQELRDLLPSHLEGQICENCMEAIEQEIGSELFYLAGLCNTLDLNLYDILLKEHKKLNTLGVFHAS